jgi:hypothetical protein
MYYVFVNDPKLMVFIWINDPTKNLLVLTFELTSLVQVLGFF